MSARDASGRFALRAPGSATDCPAPTRRRQAGPTGPQGGATDVKPERVPSVRDDGGSGGADAYVGGDAKPLSPRPQRWRRAAAPAGGGAQVRAGGSGSGRWGTRPRPQTPRCRLPPTGRRLSCRVLSRRHRRRRHAAAPRTPEQQAGCLLGLCHHCGRALQRGGGLAGSNPQLHRTVPVIGHILEWPSDIFGRDA